MILSDAHRAALDGEGFVVIRAVLAQETLDRLCRAFASAAPQTDGTQHVVVDDNMMTTTRGDWSALDRHPLALAAAQHILGRPFESRIHGRNPLPGFGQQGLHADWPPRRAHEPYHAVTAI